MGSKIGGRANSPLDLGQAIHTALLAQAFRLATRMPRVSGLNTAASPVCQLADDTLYHFLATITFELIPVIPSECAVMRVLVCFVFPGEGERCWHHAAGLRMNSGPTEG